MSVLNTWYCCQPDLSESFELCKVKKHKTITEDGIRYDYCVITYYDGKEVFSGTLSDCTDWINTHWVERRYLDQYGK